MVVTNVAKQALVMSLSTRRCRDDRILNIVLGTRLFSFILFSPFRRTSHSEPGNLNAAP